MARKAALLALLVLLPPWSARAQVGYERGDDERQVLGEDRDWHLDLAAVTSVPLSVGVEATLQTPVGVFAQLSFGHTPQAYIDAAIAALAEVDTFDDDLEPLVRDASSNGAWNIRSGLGVAVSPGFELSFGYTWLTASAVLTARAIEAAFNQRPSWGRTDAPMQLHVHAIYGRVGWCFSIERHFVLRVAIGWTHAVEAELDVFVPDGTDAGSREPKAQVEVRTGGAVAEYGFTPEVLLSAGYRF